MSDPRCWVFLRLHAAIALSLILALSSIGRAEIEDEHPGHDHDKIRIQSATVAPNPFTPPGQVTTLSTVVAVRKVAGLGEPDRDDLDDRDENREHHEPSEHLDFYVVLHWTIRDGATTIRTLESTTPVKPPLTLVRLNTRDHGAPFALVSTTLSWDGMKPFGGFVPAKRYDYVVEADFVRVHTHRLHRKVRLIDRSDPVTGTVTVGASAARTAPPSVDSYPTTTNVPLLILSGTKAANSALLVDHIVRIPTSVATTWTTTQPLPHEGLNTFDITDQEVGRLESLPVTVNVTLITVPPVAPGVNPVARDVLTPTYTISGTKAAGTGVMVNGIVVVPINGSTTWTVVLQLNPGDNNFLVETFDAAGNRSITQGGEIVGVALQKPVISPLTVTPEVVPTGQPVQISYQLFAQVPPADNADLHVVVSLEDGNQIVRTILDTVQQGGPTGIPYTVTWDGKSDSGNLVPINTSYRLIVSADRANPTTLTPDLANANPKESSITVTGSQQVVSPDGKLKIIFRPDDATLSIKPVSELTAKQSAILTARQIKPLVRPYAIAVDRPFTSPVVGILSHPKPVLPLLRAYVWSDPAPLQDWIPISRTTWNPTSQTIGFAVPDQGTILIGSGPDVEEPRVTSTSCTTASALLKIADRGSGINTTKTRVRCRGVDVTSKFAIKNLNGPREQVMTSTDPAATAGELAVYLEDFAGNARIYRVKGAGQ